MGQMGQTHKLISFETITAILVCQWWRKMAHKSQKAVPFEILSTYPRGMDFT